MGIYQRFRDKSVSGVPARDDKVDREMNVYSRTPLTRPPTGPGKSGRLRGVSVIEELVVALSDNLLNR